MLLKSSRKDTTQASHTKQKITTIFFSEANLRFACSVLCFLCLLSKILIKKKGSSNRRFEKELLSFLFEPLSLILKEGCAETKDKKIKR